MISLQTALLASAFFFTSIHSAFPFYSTEQSNCSTIDLRTEFPLKMRNQGDISWCYAHAAADYLQFYHRIPVQISAADIAVNYNHRRWPRFLRWLNGTTVPETGFIRSAIWDISLIGYCPEESFPSDLWTKRIMSGKDAGLEVKVPLGKAVEEIAQMVQNVKTGFYLSPSDLPFVYEFKGVNHQQFYDAVFVNPTGNVLDELRSAACDASRQPFPREITEISMGIRGRNTFNQINQVLDQHEPVTVDFFYGFLNNIDQYKRSISDLHTTALMGRRFNPATQECQYMIKNSYGEDCKEYDHRHQCEAGYVWVSESSLYNAMTSFVYISESESSFTETVAQTQDDQDFQSAPGVH